MATERIDIVIREQGSRVVKRELESIGATARKSADPIDFLKRALAGVGTFLAVNKVREYADAYVSLQNRLRSTGLEGAALTAVYGKLLQAANDTRAGLQGSVELYSRLAISSKELGVSQNELIGFTKSLNQAIILSGASGAEASAGLIQLSQGLASGTLRGDELRSVLEQLPAVADVIAKEMGVARGDLRKLGEEGKITAQTVIRGFQNARVELEQRFAKTIPTLSQSFEVLRNNVIDLVGRLDEQVGVSRAVSKAIFTIAQNLDVIASAVGKTIGSLLALGAAYAAFSAAQRGARLAERVQEFIAFRQAVASGAVVLLGSAEAERQRAAATAQAAVATQAATAAQGAANIAAARASAVATEAQVAQVAATQAAIVVSREEAVAKLAKANSDIASARATQAAAQAAGAQSFALATLRTATLQQAAAEQARNVVLRELAVLGTQQARVNAAAAAAAQANATAQAALNGAQASAATANAAAAAASARASATATAAAAAAAGSTSLLGQAFNGVRNAAAAAFGQVSKLFVLINTNPFTVLLTVLTAVIGLVLVFGNDINAGIDSMTTLMDVARAFGEVAVDAFRAVGRAIADAFGSLLDTVSSVLSSTAEMIGPATAGYLTSFNGFFDGVGTGFAGVLRGTARVVDAIAGLITGLVLGIVRTFSGLPTVVTAIFKKLYNGAVGVVEDLLNVVIGGVNKLRSSVGASLIDAVKLTKLEVDEKAFQTYGQSIAASIEDGFAIQGGFAEQFVNDTFRRAQELAVIRGLDQTSAGNPDLDGKGAGRKIVNDDPKGLKRLRSELESLISRIDPLGAAFREVAEAESILQRSLAKGLITGDQYADLMLKLERAFLDILDPLGAVNREYDEQEKLLRMTSDARRVEGEVLSQVKALQEQGVILNEREVATLRARIKGLQELSRVVEQQDAFLAQTVERRKQFVVQLEAIQNLLSDPSSGFTKADAVAVMPELFEGTQEGFAAQIVSAKEFYGQLESLRQLDLLSEQSVQLQKKQLAEQLIGPDLFAGTQEQIDLQVLRFQSLYQQIDMMRQADLISEQTAAQARAKVDLMMHEERVRNAQTIFGNLATLQQSGNRKLAAIGRAAAISQATIDGVLAVQKALASTPPPANYALAAAVGAAAAANVAKIMTAPQGFEQGGYTGDFGRQTPAGIVHGREFVVNADATARNRPALEAMNRGEAAPTSPGAAGGKSSTTLNTKIINVLEPSLMSDYLGSPEGEQVFVNLIRRNADAVRTIVNEG